MIFHPGSKGLCAQSNTLHLGYRKVVVVQGLGWVDFLFKDIPPSGRAHINGPPAGGTPQIELNQTQP